MLPQIHGFCQHPHLLPWSVRSAFDPCLKRGMPLCASLMLILKAWATHPCGPHAFAPRFVLHVAVAGRCSQEVRSQASLETAPSRALPAGGSGLSQESAGVPLSDKSKLQSRGDSSGLPFVLSQVQGSHFLLKSRVQGDTPNPMSCAPPFCCTREGRGDMRASASASEMCSCSSTCCQSAPPLMAILLLEGLRCTLCCGPL